MNPPYTIHIIGLPVECSRWKSVSATAMVTYIDILFMVKFKKRD